MKAQRSRDDGLWELYRSIARFVRNPNDHTEAQVKALLEALRLHAARQSITPDEHESVANYR